MDRIGNMGQVNDRRLLAEDLRIQFDRVLKSVALGHYATARATLEGAKMLIDDMERRRMTGREKLRETATNLRRGIPCGKTLGHGESCCEGYLCDGCDARLKTAADIEAALSAN